MSNQKQSRRPSVATVIACVALFAALSGSALAAGLITGKDIKKNTVTSKNIKDKTLKTGDFSKKTVKSLQGQQGPQGPAGVGSAESIADDGSVNITANNTVEILAKSVPSGRYIVFGKTNLFSVGTDQVDCVLNAGNTELDRIAWNPPANNKRAPISMQAVTAGNVTEVSMECATGTVSGSAFDRSLIAIPIG